MIASHCCLHRSCLSMCYMKAGAAAFPEMAGKVWSLVIGPAGCGRQGCRQRRAALTKALKTEE